MMKVAVGHSEDVWAEEAVREVIRQIEAELAGRKPQAGILFCSVDFDHESILACIRAAYPEMELVGCTTDGEMSSVSGFQEDSLTLMAFASDTVEIRAGAGRQMTRRGAAAGREAALSASASLSRRAGEERLAIMFADPFHAGVTDSDKGIQSVWGENFPVIGGAAAAHSKQRQTRQFYQGEVLTDSVAVLLFAGPLAFSCGIRGGHAPMGTREVITSSENNVVHRIGDKPALAYFRKYAGDVDLFINYCLAIYEPGRRGFYVRSAPSYDPDTGSVTLNGKVPQGAMIQIGTADRETIQSSCIASVRQAIQSYPGERPACALLVSCAGRKMLMGTQVVREVQAVERLLPGTPFAGFYSYGEFAPLEAGSPYLFHGTTFITLLLGDH